MNKVLFVAAACLVCGTLFAGLYVIGGPFQARMDRYDETRMSDLKGVIQMVDCKNPASALPDTLDETSLLAVCKRQVFIRSLRDPKTNALYEYRVIDGTTVEICAMFHDAVKANNQRSRWQLGRLAIDGNRGCYRHKVL